MSTSEQSENIPMSENVPKSDSPFKAGLFVQTQKKEGLEYSNKGSNEQINTPCETPRVSDQNFKNYISSDLMRRLEESSPIKAGNSFDFSRKFSEMCLVNCDNINEDNEEEITSNQINQESIQQNISPRIQHYPNIQKNPIIKLESMDPRIENRNLKSVGEAEDVINATKNLKAKNFMLRTQIFKPTSEYQRKESEDNTMISNQGDYSNLGKEPNSLFDNMMNFSNFNQNSLMSPTYKHKSSRKDSSPFYTYYNDTSEYLSQNFYDEFKKNIKSEQPIHRDRIGNLDNTYNYIKKATPMTEENRDNNTNTTRQSQQVYNPTYNKFNLDGYTQKFNIDNRPKYDINNPSFNYTNIEEINSRSNHNPYIHTSNPISPKEEGRDYMHQHINYMMNKDTPIKQIPITDHSSVPTEDDYIVEMFGRKGWICELCNNFNYESNILIFILI